MSVPYNKPNQQAKTAPEPKTVDEAAKQQAAMGEKQGTVLGTIASEQALKQKTAKSVLLGGTK